MQNKIIFREMLSEIKVLADKKGNRLTKDEVKDFFANAQLSDEQLALIYEYLASQKIKVEGFVPEQKTGNEKTEAQAQKNLAGENGPEDQRVNFLEMYLEDLEGIAQLSEKDEWNLLIKAAAGDSAAKSRLAQQYLRLVYELSMTYVGAQIPQEDLIQEGNVGLLLALEALEKKESLDDYRNFLFAAIQQSMEEAIEMSQDTRDMDEEIAGRVNHLNEAILNLEEDLGHKVSVEELSAYLEMPLEEIRDILRMAGDEMKDK